MCYGYDALNRISYIRYGNGVETAYAYDGDGNISSLETKAGENVLISFMTASFRRLEGETFRLSKVLYPERDTPKNLSIPEAETGRMRK